MDRCKLFSKLTRSNDETCTLFEEILENFFEEYTSLYGGLHEGGVVNDIANISCVGNIDSILKVHVSFSNTEINDSISKDLKSYIKNQTDVKLRVSVERINDDTILIELERK